MTSKNSNDSVSRTTQATARASTQLYTLPSCTSYMLASFPGPVRTIDGPGLATRLVALSHQVGSSSHRQTTVESSHRILYLLNPYTVTSCLMIARGQAHARS